MTTEENELNEARWRRLRRVKRWLRPLPRRTNIHRYPILKLFAETAKKRVYLWSFREEHAVPAIYAGAILTLLPIYGIQLPLSLALALLLRANLPILAGLQIISNPITAIPLWVADYQIGRIILDLFGAETMPLRRAEILSVLDQLFSGDWGNNFHVLISVFGVTCLGAVVMGIFFGVVGAFSYRIVARRTSASYQLLVKKIHQLKERKQREL